MNPAAHALLFLLSASVIWFLSGILIDAIDRVAARYNKPGFAVAFFVLGLLTSISEISVATNATFEGVPQVSAGNLLGASTVIFLLIIPLLAVLGNGIPMSRILTPGLMIFLLGIVLLPALVSLDGSVGVSEGLVMLLLYAALLYVVQKRQPTERQAREAIKETEMELLHKTRATVSDVIKIAAGGVLIFVAGNLLVDESIYFAQVMHIPVSFVGLLALSIGTNTPELVIAIRCVLGRHKDIAFGDYMGSAAANTLVYGALVLANGTFAIDRGEVLVTFAIFAVGLGLFFVFARSKEILSRREGFVLLSLYASFVAIQVLNAIGHHGQPLEALRKAEHAASAEIFR